MARRAPLPPPSETPAEPASDHVLAAAGGFTGLWALTWLGAAATGAGGTVQGGFAVGGVMAGSGLTLLWWKTSALRMLQKQNADADAEAEQAAQAEPTDAA
jgi:hypothetical protein